MPPGRFPAPACISAPARSTSTANASRPRAFAGQRAEALAVSACQRFTLAEPGLHLITVKVMARGVAALDRGQVAYVARREAPPPPAATRLQAMLLLPARATEATERVAINQSFDEHGLTAATRDYSRVAYRLKAGETFASAAFEATSAANASAVRTAYQPAQRAVTVAFSLRSGPLYDRWRGWISGSVAVRLLRDSPARELPLPDAALAIPGQAVIPLPPEALEAGERFTCGSPGRMARRPRWRRAARRCWTARGSRCGWRGRGWCWRRRAEA